MDTRDALVDQHFKESELRLRHVDALVQQVRGGHAARTETIDDALLARVESQRRALAAALERMKRLPPADRVHALEHGRGLYAALETVGTELEKALASVLDGRL